LDFDLVIILFKKTPSKLSSISGKDATVKLFDLRKCDDEVEVYKLDQDARSIAWHPTCPSVFAAGEQNGTITQWMTT
jgi:WD40 repeat protein